MLLGHVVGSAGAPVRVVAVVAGLSQELSLRQWRTQVPRNGEGHGRVHRLEVLLGSGLEIHWLTGLQLVGGKAL